MRGLFHAATGAVLSALLSLTGAQAQSGADAPAPRDPCAFFQGQAFGQGLDHFKSEMLWACREIARREAAGMPLGPRLASAADALARYRAAHAAASARVFAERRRLGERRFGLGSDETDTLAARSGALAALEQIRTGF